MGWSILDADYTPFLVNIPRRFTVLAATTREIEAAYADHPHTRVRSGSLYWRSNSSACAARSGHPKTCDRALQTANTFCFAAEMRGFEVTLTSDSARLLFKGHGAEVAIRISEKLSESLQQISPYPGAPEEPTKIKVPSGTLRLLSGLSAYTEREITADDSRAALSSKLNAPFVRIYQQIVRERESEREKRRSASRVED